MTSLLEKLISEDDQSWHDRSADLSHFERFQVWVQHAQTGQWWLDSEKSETWEAWDRLVWLTSKHERLGLARVGLMGLFRTENASAWETAYLSNEFVVFLSGEFGI